MATHAPSSVCQSIQQPVSPASYDKGQMHLSILSRTFFKSELPGTNDLDGAAFSILRVDIISFLAAAFHGSWYGARVCPGIVPGAFEGAQKESHGSYDRRATKARWDPEEARSMLSLEDNLFIRKNMDRASCIKNNCRICVSARAIGAR